MKNKINYKIHIGEHSFKVNEWLYKYFNSIKDNPRLYKKVCKILNGIIK